jgi:hypothetical protein
VEIITIKVVVVALPVPVVEVEVEAGGVKRANRCKKCHRLPLWPGWLGQIEGAKDAFHDPAMLMQLLMAHRLGPRENYNYNYDDDNDNDDSVEEEGSTGMLLPELVLIDCVSP